MTTWARKVGSSYVDIITVDPSTLFHPDVAAQFVALDEAMTAPSAKVEKPKKKGGR